MEHGIFSAITGCDEPRILQILLNYPDSVFLINSEEYTPLLYAINIRSPPSIISLLLNEGKSDPNYRVKDGLTAIKLATIRNNTELIETLVNKHGVDVDTPDANDISPLQYAVRFSSPDTVETLIRLEADINRIDERGYNLLHRTILQEYAYPSKGNSRLKIIDILLNAGIDINEADDINYNTPLILAIIYRTPSIISILLSRGAAINNINMKGYTALHYAIEKQDYVTAELLIEKRGICVRYPPDDPRISSIDPRAYDYYFNNSMDIGLL